MILKAIPGVALLTTLATCLVFNASGRHIEAGLLTGEQVFQLSKIAMIASTENIEKLRRSIISQCEIDDLDSGSEISLVKLDRHNILRITGELKGSDRFNYLHFSFDVGDDVLAELVASLRSWF